MTLGQRYLEEMGGLGFTTATELADWRTNGRGMTPAQQRNARNRVMKRVQLANIDAKYPRLKDLRLEWHDFRTQPLSLHQKRYGEMDSVDILWHVLMHTTCRVAADRLCGGGVPVRMAGIQGYGTYYLAGVSRASWRILCGTRINGGHRP